MGWRALLPLAVGGSLLAALQLGGDLGGPLLPCFAAAAVCSASPKLIRRHDALRKPANLLSLSAITCISFSISCLTLGTPFIQSLTALIAGHILLAPWLLSLSSTQYLKKKTQWLSLEFAALAVLTTAITIAISSGLHPFLTRLPEIGLLPILVWAAYRLPMPAATTIQILPIAIVLILHAHSIGGSNLLGAVSGLPLRALTSAALISQLIMTSHRHSQRHKQHHLRNRQRLSHIVKIRTNKLESAITSLSNLCTFDELTGIANRRHFDEVITKEWRRCLRRAEPLTIGLIDIDHFKRYNDFYGHIKGDETLRVVAQCLNQCLGRSEDFLARYGGEEFVVVLPGLNEFNATRIGEHLRAAVEALGIEHSGESPAQVVTISAGFASCTPDTLSSAKGLLELADQSLYRAKELGRNTVFVHSKIAVRDTITREQGAPNSHVATEVALPSFKSDTDPMAATEPGLTIAKLEAGYPLYCKALRRLVEEGASLEKAQRTVCWERLEILHRSLPRQYRNPHTHFTMLQREYGKAA